MSTYESVLELRILKDLQDLLSDATVFPGKRKGRAYDWGEADRTQKSAKAVRDYPKRGDTR